MSFESFVTERLADLTEKYNALVTNAKTIFELPVQNNLDPTSLIHVSRNQVSESLSVQKIIDAVSAGDYDHLISIGDITVSGTDVTFPASAEWVISNTYYQNIADIERPIPLAATGLTRIDIAVANTSNDIVIMSGDETDGIAVRPNIPVGTVLVTQINVDDSSIGDPDIPILGTEYVKKLESQDVIVNYGATTVIDHIDLTDDRSSISLVGSATDVKSIQVSGEFIRMGKPHFFKNRTGHNVKLWHLAGTGNIKYFFPNGLDLIVKPNEVIQFNTNANDSSVVRFEYVGNFVPGVMIYKGSVANYAALPSTGLSIGDVYNLTDTGHNYAWSGTVWDDLGPAVDVSGKEDTSNKSNDIETDKASTSKYGNIAAWISWLKTYFFSNLPAKSSALVDADLIIAGDSVDSFKTKTRTFLEFFTNLKTRLDLLYAPKSDTYAKAVYVNNNNPNSATIFDLANPPVTNDNALKSDVNNLYIGLDASTWVYNSTTSTYGTKVVVNLFPVEVTGNQTVQESWNNKDVYFMGSGTLTYPNSGLSAGHNFNLYADVGVTIAWAITSPKTWRVAGLSVGTAPISVTAGQFCMVQARIGSNEIRVLGL